MIKQQENNEEELVESLKKVKIIVEKSNAAKPTQELENVAVDKKDINKSLKELKETAFVLRQRLDTLQSDKNVMDVEYSQVFLFVHTM